MKQPHHLALALRRIGICLAFCAAGLASCGGGGGSSAPPPPAPPVPAPPVTPAAPTGDFGGSTLGKVARTGVAGTWGYVAPDGTRYALMGTAKGILVLDLRDSANPRVVDEIDGPTNTSSPGIYWREMRVYGSHAYIVSEHDNVRGGVMIVDLSGLPNTVRYVKSITPKDGQLTAHTIDIDTPRGLMYLQRRQSGAAPAPPAPAAAFERPGAGADGIRIGANAHDPGKGEHHEALPGQGSIEIWDIKTDPENPRYLSTFNQFKSVHDMTAAGDYAYVAEGEASSFSMWDVKNPAAPVLVVRWPVAAGNYAHNIWPSGDGSFVVTTEEIPNGLPARVWQLNGAAAPTQLSTIKFGTGTPHNVVMEGRMAYFSHYTEGALVVDLNNPAAPRLVARVDTTAAAGPSLEGCWGVYKFPGAPLMMCSDINTGFHLIGITGQ